MKKPIKAWGNMHCFQIRLNCSKIRSKKKKKDFFRSIVGDVARLKS